MDDRREGMMNIDNLTRRTKRLEDQAARHIAASKPVRFICYWGNEDVPREPGAIHIITDWSSGAALAREDQDGDD
jgi:hypothetical protein